MVAHRTHDRALVAGRYARGERLGHGGFGVVWRARDTLLEREVAVKEVLFPSTLDPDEKAALREKVLSEARAAARISHPGFVTVFDVVEEDGRPLIVMELVDAPTLSEHVLANGPLSDREAASVGGQLLDALSAAHADGIVHRDVKPANVMVHRSGRVQLADFGVASMLDDPKVTGSGELAGSPPYMAPEQANNRAVGPATDLWGLGATLYYAVEGLPPFDKGGALATLTSVVNDPPRPARRAGRRGPLLTDLLTKEPEARPPAEEVRRRLSDVAAPSVERDPTANLDLAGTMTIATATAAEPARAPVAEPVPPAEPEPAPSAIVETAPSPVFEPPPAPPPPEPAPPPQAAPPPPAPWSAAPGAVAAGPEVRPKPSPPRPTRPRTDSTKRAPLVAIALVVVLLGALVAVLAVRDDDPGDGTPASGPNTTAASAGGPSVPRDWVQYQDPDTGFTVAHPPTWTVSRSGTLTDIRDPVSRAYLRIDHQQPPGPSPEGAWAALEPRFAADNSNYQRVQLTPTTYKGYRAAIWEFTYTDGGADLHAVDLGFIAGKYGFALFFQTRVPDWARMQPMFEQFKESFKAPN